MSDLLRECRSEGAALAAKYRLSMSQPKNAGVSGNWLGVGTGSSIDFQDHRPYAPGDDPRYINWQAYARSGDYTMKLYRDEVSPLVDVLVDISPSMMRKKAKAKAALSLFYFCVESCLSVDASLRCFSIAGDDLRALSADEVLSGAWSIESKSDLTQLVPDFESVPWRAQSARVLVSDFLFPGSPEALLKSFGMRSTWSAAFSVYDEAEANPDWGGSMKLVDSETGGERILHCDQETIRKYRQSYDRHFGMWMDYFRKRGSAFWRVSADEPLEAQASRSGVVSGALAI
ncbi:MAG: DUF58 domain-containing protein [Verrucomicrobiota bacterium]